MDILTFLSLSCTDDFFFFVAEIINWCGAIPPYLSFFSPPLCHIHYIKYVYVVAVVGRHGGSERINTTRVRDDSSKL